MTWLVADHAEDRLVIAGLRKLGRSAHPDVIATATGLTVELVKQTASVPAPSFQHSVSPKISHPPAVLKNEWRGRPRCEQQLTLTQCPHDCEGLVDTPLWTPETDRPSVHASVPGAHQLAALCSTCRRTPHHEATFPEVYLRHWSVGHNRTEGQKVGTRTLRTAEDAGTTYGLAA